MKDLHLFMGTKSQDAPIDLLRRHDAGRQPWMPGKADRHALADWPSHSASKWISSSSLRQPTPHAPPTSPDSLHQIDSAKFTSVAMALQIVSDLHLEIHDDYVDFTIKPHAPVLALLGDIGLVARHREALASFLARHLREFEAILFVPGNHEAYHSTWPRTRQILQQFEDEVMSRREAGDTSLGDLVIMDRQAYRLPGPSHQKVVVLGCSLFSHVPPFCEHAVHQAMNDFRLTAGWDVTTHNDAHLRDRNWLNEAVTSMELNGDPDLKIVILSHWSPTPDARARDPRHGDARNDALASAFATDMTQDPCFRSPKVCAWAFGHTHYNCDFFVDRQTTSGAPPIRLLANQRGYSNGGAPKFDPGKVLLIE